MLLPYAAAVKALNEPDIRARYRDDGTQIIASSPEEFAATSRSEIDRIGRLVRTLGIEAE